MTTVNGDGDTVFVSVEFAYGTVFDYKKHSLFRKSTTVSLSDKDAAADLFKFFADNGNVEFSLVTTNGDDHNVTTQHKTSEVNVSKIIKHNEKKGLKTEMIMHNHPNNSTPNDVESFFPVFYRTDK